jgi:hypothetical protein
MKIKGYRGIDRKDKFFSGNSADDLISQSEEIIAHRQLDLFSSSQVYDQ